jgi:tRNA(fMet)-specific endonuclease VapC
MTRFLIDTNHASLLYRQDARLTQRFKSASGEFFLCLPAIGELWFMVYNSARVAENETRLRRFLSTFIRLEFDDDAAIEFGKIRAEARRSGRGIADVDTQIAAIARVHGLILLTDDSDFDSVAGLQMQNWLR